MMNWMSILITIVSFISGQSIEAVGLGGLVDEANRQNVRQQFQNIEGATLKVRMENAVKAGNASGNKYWVGYSFDVKPGIAMDYEFRSGENITIINGATINTQVETRNLGVFMLYEAGSLSRLEIYNLDRQREYSGYPVYWLGRAGNEESLNYLKDLVDDPALNKISERAVMAIGVHDDKRVGSILKTLIQQSKKDKIRSTAVFWLGYQDGEISFLADLVRNQQENLDVRKQAIFAIGLNHSNDAIPTLQNLYGISNQRELKRQVIFGISVNKDKNSGIDFLIKLAESEPDIELKKQAMFWLGQKAGERALKTLTNLVDQPDADTEVQRQAVFAISRRDKDEAVPLLIKIAKNHPKMAVRKQALFWLGQTGDQRALDLFKEILSQ